MVQSRRRGQVDQDSIASVSRLDEFVTADSSAVFWDLFDLLFRLVAESSQSGVLLQLGERVSRAE